MFQTYLLFFLIFLFGCASPEVKRRYFWPPPPETPRIEFVASYWNEDDFPMSAKKKVLDITTGVEQAPGFDKPWGIASNGEGKVYITDTNLGTVVIFDIKEQKVRLIGEEQKMRGGPFLAPVGITLDGNGNIYVSDPRRNRIYSFTKDEKPLRVIGNDKTLNWPVGMAVDGVRGRLYVVNGRNHSIAVFDLEGQYLTSFGQRGSGDGEFNFPTDLDVDSKGNIVVADSMNARVQVFDPDGRFIRKFGQRGDRPEDFRVIKGIAVSREGNIFVVDSAAERILVFNNEGDPLTSIGGTAAVAETMRLNPGGFLIPQDISIDKNDTIYVVDSMNKRFQIFQIINEEWLKSHPIE